MREKPIVRFSPQGTGLAKVLGSREAEIMEIIWQQGPMSVAEVRLALRSDRKIAHTTVMTIMSRLAEKGLLHKTPSGNAYLYSAAINREELGQQTVRSVINGLLEEFAKPAVAYFVGRLAQEDEATLSEIERIIEERKRQG